MLLVKLYVLYINVLKLRGNPLVLLYNKPNSLLVIIKDINCLTKLEL